MSSSASALHESSIESVTLLRYFDVVVIVVAAPILLLIGVSATGYAVGGGSWIVLRAIGVGVERYAKSVKSQPTREIAVRLSYLLGRLFALALAIVLVRRGDGRSAGLTALLVIVFAFTVQLAISAMTRPRKR